MLKTENGLIIRMCKVLMRGKMMGVNFEFNFEELDNNELRINGRRADFLSFRQWRSIIIKKEWISWIITTLRNLTYEDYNTWEKTVGINYEDCELAIIMCLFEREHSYIDIFPIWKDEERITPPIEIPIPYLSWNKRLLMSEFIEPFLVALSQFLTEEERGKLPPPWSERKEDKKGKKKRKKDDQSDDERISVRFAGEIDPRDYFG